MRAPVPQPTPGRYLDTAGTLYTAHRHKSAGWFLQRLTGHFGAYNESPFQYEQFPIAVQSGAFTLIPPTI